jgi:hypothetical protein
MLAALVMLAMPNDDAVITALENVKASAGHRYAAKDDKGDGLDCLKIVEVGKGNYLGVYHAQKNGVFTLKLARSSDLLNWKHVRDLDDHAHQGTLTSATGPMMLAYEKDGSQGNWIRFRAYASAESLLAGSHQREFDLTRTLSKYAEGTPSLHVLGTLGTQFGVTTWVGLSFHYLTDDGVDRQARGSLAFSPRSQERKEGFNTEPQWQAQPEEKLNRAAKVYGIKGNFGDRDRFGRLTLIEGQLRKHDWSSWRVFLWDNVRLRQLSIKTHGGSTAFANPTATPVTLPDGKKGLVVTLFIPSEGAAKGESGCLIYYFAAP